MGWDNTTLDKDVAEKVMGWEYQFSIVEDGIRSSGGVWCSDGKDHRFTSAWAPESDLNDAMVAVAHLRGQGWDFELDATMPPGDVHEWRACFFRTEEDEEFGIHKVELSAMSKIPAEAICRAALDAVVKAEAVSHG